VTRIRRSRTGGGNPEPQTSPFSPSPVNSVTNEEAPIKTLTAGSTMLRGEQPKKCVGAKDYLTVQNSAAQA
jgi:hypothetical protein